MYYTNQRLVAINREIVKKTTNRKYLCCYIDNIEEAMKKLSKTGFQVYIYLLCNRDGYELEYSPTHISYKTSMCLESARKAFIELEKNGYLIQSKESKHFYTFYEKPIEQEKEHNIVNPLTGEIISITYREALKQFGLQGILLWEDDNNEDDD